MAGSPSEPFGGCGGNWASSLSVPESRQASRVRSGECWGHGAGWGPHAPGLAPAPHCRVQARRPGSLAAHVFCWIPVPPSEGLGSLGGLGDGLLHPHVPGLDAGVMHQVVEGLQALHHAQHAIHRLRWVRRGRPNPPPQPRARGLPSAGAPGPANGLLPSRGSKGGVRDG